MVLDTKIQHLKDHFGITRPEDWSAVRPEWITSLDGIGPVTLDHVRLYLSARGLALKDDRTAEYWQQHLAAARIGHTMGNAEIADDVDRGIVAPFTILIDSAEQHPFTFQGFYADADQGHRPLIVPTESRALGRHPIGLGDYSLSTGLNRCHIERKSLQDAHGTILGWDGRRERFEQELQNLSQLEFGAVVLECSFADLLRTAPARGKRSAQDNARTLQRSVLAFMQDYSARWIFCDGRRMAEQATFRLLQRFDRKLREGRKEDEKKYRRKDGEVLAVQQIPSASVESAADIEMQLANL